MYPRSNGAEAGGSQAEQDLGKDEDEAQHRHRPHQYREAEGGGIPARPAGYVHSILQAGLRHHQAESRAFQRHESLRVSCFSVIIDLPFTKYKTLLTKARVALNPFVM